MFQLPSPIEQINHPLLERHVKLWIKRDDLIHPQISGNKWRKLKYNFENALKNPQSPVVTFGGAYSNHIAATAAAGHYFGIPTIGYIRGEELDENSNPTLKLASQMGMELRFISRDEYAHFKSCNNLTKLGISNAFVIPEGGANSLAIQGTSEIIDELKIEFDTIVTSIGTGGTFCGLVKGLNGEKRVLGMNSRKGGFIHDEISQLLQSEDITHNNYKIDSTHHFGGYGKVTPTLIDFINGMKSEIGVLFDPIYTGKAFFGVWDMIGQGRFDGQPIVFLHTGGLQGIAGFNQKSTQKIHN